VPPPIIVINGTARSMRPVCRQEPRVVEVADVCRRRRHARFAVENGMSQVSRPSRRCRFVIVTPDSYETIRKTVQHLRRPDGERPPRDRDRGAVAAQPRARRPAHRRLSAGPGRRGRRDQDHRRSLRAGIREARAPLVSCLETTPSRAGLGGALIDAHRPAGGDRGTGVCANAPDNLISWLIFSSRYGPGSIPPRREIDHLPDTTAATSAPSPGLRSAH